MVADALIQHPVVAHYLRYVATTVGRDKALRTVQYFARFYAWYLYRTNNPNSAVQPWTKVKSQFGLTRKIMRIGKFVEHFRAANELYDAAMKSGSGDKVVQYLQILRQLSYGGYMLTDMITIMDMIGFKKLENFKKIQEISVKCWLSGLITSALAGIYTNYQLAQRASVIDEKDAEGKLEKTKIAKQRVATNKQLIQDFCDMTIPSSTLGYTNFDDGFVGLAGTFSSILGVQTVWAKTA